MLAVYFARNLKLLPDIEFIVTLCCKLVVVVIYWFCHIFRCVACISCLHLPSHDFLFVMQAVIMCNLGKNIILAYQFRSHDSVLGSWETGLAYCLANIGHRLH